MKRVVCWKYSLIIMVQRRPTSAVEGVVVLRNHKKDKSTTVNCQRLRVYTSLTPLSLSCSIISFSLSDPILKQFFISGCWRFRNMANRPQVPKFGDWTEDAPFTVVFEKASKSKKNRNVSNPNEYPEMNPDSAQNRKSRHDQPPNHNVRPRHERFSSREETEFRPSPAHNERNNRVRAPTTPETYGGGGRSLGNPSETNRPKFRDHGPVRPIRNLRGQSSERVATIPPFPGSGSNMENQSYTLIFDKVKEDRNQARSYNGTEHSTPTRPIIDQHHQPLPSSPKGCCFPPWSRK